MRRLRLFWLFLLVTIPLALFGAESVDWIRALGGKVERDSSGQIVVVNLRGSWVNDVEMMDLARLPHLERLDLSHTRITDEGLLLLKPAPTIKDLNLYYAELITDQGISAIKDWKHLKRLNVRGTRVSDGTLEIISRLTDLEALDIANTPITDNGLDFLITLTSVKEPSLGARRLSDGLLEVLRLLPTLTYLDLSGPRLTDRPDVVFGNRTGESGVMDEKKARAIAELKELRVLKLGYSNISADGLKILTSLNQVEKLGLQACSRIDDRAMTELVNWKSLRYVDLQDTKVTEKGLEELRKARPDLVVLGPSVTVGKPSPQSSAAKSAR